MKKGNTGINLYFFAAFAFILVLIGQTSLCGMLLGFVILAERDEWLTKQVIQAFGLTVCTAFVGKILSSLSFFNSIPFIGPVFYGVFGFISGIVNLLFLILAIIAIVRVMKGTDAGIPLLQKFANWAYGTVMSNPFNNGNGSNTYSGSNSTDSTGNNGQNNRQQ